MRVGIVVVIAALALGACAKKKSQDKAPAATEPAPTAAPATEPPKEQKEGGATDGKLDVGGAPGGGSQGETKAHMPSDDGGEAKARMPSDDGGEVKKPMPSDDGGEAAKKACSKTEDCGAKHDCCNGFCFKQGTAKHSIECKLPAGKL